MALAVVNNQNLMSTDDESGLTPEELAELRGDLVHVKTKLPRWRFNGGDGIFVQQAAFKADKNGIRDRSRNAAINFRNDEFGQNGPAQAASTFATGC